MDKGYSTGIYLFSSVSCKLFVYLSISFYSLSSLILIYILIESYLSIKYPVESNLLRKNKPQFIYTIRLWHGSGGTQTIYVNRSNTDSNDAATGRNISTITAMEIAA